MKRLARVCTLLLLGCGDDGGEDTQASGAEAQAIGDFACGSMLECDGDTEYCEVVLNPMMLPVSYHCVELPMECVDGPAPECECLVETTCEMCEASPEGGLTSSCVPE